MRLSVVCTFLSQTYCAAMVTCSYVCNPYVCLSLQAKAARQSRQALRAQLQRREIRAEQLLARSSGASEGLVGVWAGFRMGLMVVRGSPKYFRYRKDSSLPMADFEVCVAHVVSMVCVSLTGHIGCGSKPMRSHFGVGAPPILEPILVGII